jgi:hypothetical protein
MKQIKQLRECRTVPLVMSPKLPPDRSDIKLHHHFNYFFALMNPDPKLLNQGSHLVMNLLFRPRSGVECPIAAWPIFLTPILPALAVGVEARVTLDAFEICTWLCLALLPCDFRTFEPVELRAVLRAFGIVERCAMRNEM